MNKNEKNVLECTSYENNGHVALNEIKAVHLNEHFKETKETKTNMFKISKEQTPEDVGEPLPPLKETLNESQNSHTYVHLNESEMKRKSRPNKDLLTV